MRLTVIGMALCALVMLPAATAVAAEAYQLGPEDVLEVSVWKEEGLQKEVLVRPDGALSFPLVGEIQAQGKTLEQVRGEIAERLRRFIPDPVVSVSLTRIGANKIYVIGQTNKPGVYVTGQYLDVMQALSLAGGLTPFAAAGKITILRRENGREIAIPFDYQKVAKGEHLNQNILLRNGDVVVVP